MNRRLPVFASVVSLCLASAGPVIAQGPPHDLSRRAEMIKKYDKDGDGRISAEEREAMKKNAGTGRKSATGAIKRDAETVIVNDGEIEHLLRRFDENADGKLNYGEMDALRRFMRRNGKESGGNSE